MRKFALMLFVGLLAPTMLLAGTQDNPRVELRFNTYYDYDEMIAAFEKLHEAYPEMTKMTMIGKSFEGRDMWVMTIHNPKTGAEMRKPAMWVDGNIHGNEVQGGETCLYLAWYLLENYGKLERITTIVDRTVGNHDALWLPCGSGGIQDISEVFE